MLPEYIPYYNMAKPHSSAEKPAVCQVAPSWKRTGHINRYALNPPARGRWQELLRLQETTAGCCRRNVLT